MTVTTIKVPSELRDRLAAKAKQHNATMAAVIAHALDEAEEQEFWRRVREENARITDEERAERVHDSTLLDNLHDPADEAISIRGEW